LKRLVSENIEILTKLDPKVGAIHVDPSQLTQVILNLAVNARDAMPSGGKLTIETNNVELDETYRKRHLGVKPGSYVMMTVSDTGQGMPPELLTRIYEPFFTTKEQGKGTGLGLSTVLGIVRQSGGDISVYSEVGKGTAFKIFFPIFSGHSVAAAESPEKQVATGNTGTILVVEDEQLLREVAIKVLRRAGYEVLESNDGNEALQMLAKRTENVDLIMTDLVMPGMSGPELIQKIYSSGMACAKSAKVIFMSGYSAHQDLEAAMADGRASFLQKPFTTKSLLQKVKESLS
jgi:two-component system, cell cycle sensor histidine kinase and response regulator CckA